MILVSTLPLYGCITVQEMKNQFIFVSKVLFISAVISCFIKYIAPNFSIPGTATNALIIILLPNIIMLSVLIWQVFRVQKLN